MSKFDKHFRMNEQDAIEYVLEKLDFFDDNAELQSKEIGDGNINYVFKVWDKNTNKSIIIKHADTVLRSSGRALDVNRNKIEAMVLMQQEKLAPNLVPKIYKYDSVMCILAMEDVSAYHNLRTELLKRNTFQTLAEDITTFLVNTLLPTTDLVMDSGEKKDQVKEYINKDLCKISEDLVFTEPYIDYKGRNIILKENFEFVKEVLYDDENLILEVGKLKNNFMNNAQALVHGDLHSGSIFANETGIKVLDPEFAFYGPMGYDVGNVIGNLFFAWAHAYVADVDKDEELNKKEFLDWLSRTIEEIVDLFIYKFNNLYKEIVTDEMAKKDYYRKWYLDSVLADSAGSAGLEIIRRVVGDSKVADVTTIEDIDKRVKAERLLINIGKEMIISRNNIKNGKDFIDILKKHLV
ncbi:methylthioribose kinase [Vallitalea longa]|uniref:S-methyl-5-thioribose kinase n=1 Tax=Vallitalea longa TaxID=2936439 RepID=A0A9W5YDV9_9FIRM|nr:S-methyl-5-thioribose kinase [Vallitalea longa]GKX30876.1 methylthioribose kinase [Vallitalea longa]